MKKILAIDDKEDNLITIKAILKNYLPDCILWTALSGIDGIEIAKNEQPDVILLDIIMPVMDGYEVCRLLKADESTRHIPVIMITAIRTDSQSRVIGLKTGADAFLSKPIDPAEFIAQVNVMLRIKEAEDILRQENEQLEVAVANRTNELRESKEKYKALYENAPLSYQSLNEDGCFIDVNPAWLRTLGYERYEVIGKSYIDFLHPDWKGHFERNFPAFKKRGYVNDVQFKIRHKAGHYIDISFEGCIGYYPDGSFKQTYCVFADITERKLMLEQLQKSEELKRLILETTLEGFCIVDLFGRIIYVNDSYCRLIGYSREELLNMSVKDVEGLESQTNVESRIERILSKGNDNFESLHKCKNGSFIDVGISINYLSADKCFFVFIHDVTELKRNERALKKLSLAVEQCPVSIVITDTHGNIEYGNPKVAEITGYVPEELIGRNPRIFKSGETTKKEYQDLWATISSGNEWSGEFHNAKKNGELYWEHATISPIFNEKGAISHFLAVKEDVTERKKTEQIQKVIFDISKAALATENLEQLIKLIQIELGTVIDTTNFFLALYDSKTDTINLPFFSDQYDDFKSLPASNTITNYVINSKTSLLADLEKLHELENAGLISRHGADSLIWLGVPLKIDKEVIGVIAVQSYTNKDAYNESDEKILEFISDQISIVIQRKKDEESLLVALEKAEESENTYRLLFESISDAVMISEITEDGRSGKFIQVNDIACKRLGYTREELLKKTPIEINSDKAKLAIPIIMGKIFDKNQHIIETEHVAKDGRIIPVEISTQIAQFNDKTVFYSIARDVTQRKLAEKELLNALEKAEESDRLKSAFLANMSHEIRTPMNGILGFAEVLKDPDLTSEQQQEYLGIIERSGARMLNIINEIVDISKIESGQMKVLISETNVNEQLMFITKFFQTEAETKGLQLSYKTALSTDDAVLLTDREKLYAILTNLVKNAIKYTDEGSIEFGCKILETRQSVSLQFYVKDTGIGIPKHRQKAIFERFIQADIVDKMARQGAGLGLAISKAYIEMLGGKIWVESEDGKGSAFYFTLPFTTEPRKKESIHNEILHQIDEIPAINLKILIAEDDESSSKLVSLSIQKITNEIILVKTGKEAVDACRDNPDIDLVLMDIQMPEMDGYEATRQIRQFNKDVIIFAQTAFALSGDKEKTLDAGCNDYIAKPIRRDTLLELVQKYFGN